MPLEFREATPPAPVEGIARLEQELGGALPDEYRHWLAGRDGGWACDNNRALDSVFGIRQDAPYSENMWRKRRVFSGRVPSWLLPVAQDVYGNLFTLSLRESDRGSVWFWDHEGEADVGEQPAEDNLTLLASGWLVFLDGIEPVGV